MKWFKHENKFFKMKQNYLILKLDFFSQHYHKKTHFFVCIHEHVLLLLSNNELLLNRNAFSADYMLVILKVVKNKFFCILENDKKH